MLNSNNAPPKPFTQKPQVYALAIVNGKLFAMPAIILGSFTAILCEDEISLNIVAFTPRENVVNNFNIYPESEDNFFKTANLNIANALFAHINNLVVSENIRATYNMQSSISLLQMKNEFIDFIADLCMESYRSGTNIALIGEEVRVFIANIIQHTGTVDFLYEVMPLVIDGVKRFTEMLDNTQEIGKFDVPLAEEDLDFLGNL